MGSKNGQAIRGNRRSSASRKSLGRFIARADKRGDLDEWRRGRAVLGYIEGKSAQSLASELGVWRSAIAKWLISFQALGIPGIRTRKAPGQQPALSLDQRERLGRLIDAGPIEAGYTSGVWTGPIVGDLIEKEFGIRFHDRSVPRLLNKMGFSVQRPRKRLARADAVKQAHWVRTRFPAIKKKRLPVAES
jgi:transposase